MELAYNDDYGFGFASQILWQAPDDREYFIAVSGYAGRTGSYTLTVREV